MDHQHEPKKDQGRQILLSIKKEFRFRTLDSWWIRYLQLWSNLYRKIWHFWIVSLLKKCLGTHQLQREKIKRNYNKTTHLTLFGVTNSSFTLHLHHQLHPCFNSPHINSLIKFYYSFVFTSIHCLKVVHVKKGSLKGLERERGEGGGLFSFKRKDILHEKELLVQ